MRNLGKFTRCQAATPREMDSERTRHRALEAHEELPFSLALGKKQEARALLSAAGWTQGRTSQGRVLLARELLSAYER